ncbi:MAG: amino acid permease [Desulfohalobiaceae bacterium]|nr:amino acid permease [Desulfohalobiaceae bacterium]
MKNALNNHELKRELGLFSAIMLVVANMVGTGIFTTTGFIMQEVNNPYTMLASWLVGGLFALFGALCYGELGALFPQAGGEYVYLREGYGKAMGFLTGWISLIVGFSAPIAAAAIAFATYLFQALPLSGEGLELTLGGVRLFELSPITVTAVAVILLLSLIHFHSLTLGSKVQNGLTIFKIGFLLLFIICGFWLGQGSTEHIAADFEAGSLFQGSFAVSLVFVAFAYSGWNAAVYLGGEITNPGRNIPLALVTGTLLVMGLYLLLNLVFLYALSPDEISGVLEIGTKSADALFGPSSGTIFSLAISLGLLSVLSAMIVCGPRIYYAMARDNVFFRIFSRVRQGRSTPAHSIFLQAGIACAMVLTTSFDGLLLYVGFTLSLFAVLTVLGLFRIRWSRPELRSRYRTLGYPVTPLLFVLGNAWIIYFTLANRPLSSICGLVTIGSGLLVYWHFHRRNNGGGSGPSFSARGTSCLLALLVLCSALLLSPGTPSKALAHGTEGEVAVRQGVLVEAKYSDGEPMAYANISISRIGEDTPFQQGNLDRQGRFLFLPDKNGTWTVEITDGMGHRLALSKEISELDQLASIRSREGREKASLPLTAKAGMGLAVILGLSGIWAWWASCHRS